MVEETATSDQKVQHEAALSCNGSVARHRGKGSLLGRIRREQI